MTNRKSLTRYKRHLGDTLLRTAADYVGGRAAMKMPQRWHEVGEVVGVEKTVAGAGLQLSAGYCQLRWVTHHCIEIVFASTWDDITSLLPSETAVNDSPAAVAHKVDDMGDVVWLSTSHTRCRIDKANGAIDLFSRAPEPLLMDAILAFGDDNHNGTRLTAVPAADTHGYGLGMWSPRTDGHTVATWNAKRQYAVPFYVGVAAAGAFGIYWDNPARGIVDTHNPLVFASEGGNRAARFYLMAGRHMADVIDSYMRLIGAAALPPLWHLGLHVLLPQANTQDDVIEMARHLREDGIPCDTIHLGMTYMDAYKVGTWDTKHFPEFAAMVTELHRMGFKITADVIPAVRVAANNEAYASGIAQQVFVGAEVPVEVVSWGGRSLLPDFYAEDVRLWWVNQLKRLIQTGIDGIVNVDNEPAVVGADEVTTLPDEALHPYRDGHTTHANVHNLYSSFMARASRDALYAFQPQRRPVNMAQAGFAGVHRHTSLVLDEMMPSWDGLRDMLVMAVHASVSGAGVVGVTVPGNNDAELYVRWLQAAVLMPVVRIEANLHFSKAFHQSVRQAVAFRYQLMPYLYSLAAGCAMDGVPIVRPMAYNDTSPDVAGIEDQYMVGDALLVAPIIGAGQRQRDVVLPAGDWYDLWTQQLILGGQTVRVAAELDRLPAFVRAGAVVPIWRAMTNLSAPHLTTAKMRVYPGVHQMSIYEDQGDGFDYVDGAYRWTRYETRWSNNRFRIVRQVEGNYEPAHPPSSIEVIGFESEPLSIRIDGELAPVWYYENKTVEISVSEFESIEITVPIGPSDETVVSRPKLD